jgi:hypothetical protein
LIVTKEVPESPLNLINCKLTTVLLYTQAKPKLLWNFCLRVTGCKERGETVSLPQIFSMLLAPQKSGAPVPANLVKVYPKSIFSEEFSGKMLSLRYNLRRLDAWLCNF